MLYYTVCKMRLSVLSWQSKYKSVALSSKILQVLTLFYSSNFISPIPFCVSSCRNQVLLFIKIYLFDDFYTPERLRLLEQWGKSPDPEIAAEPEFFFVPGDVDVPSQRHESCPESSACEARPVLAYLAPHWLKTKTVKKLFTKIANSQTHLFNFKYEPSSFPKIKKICAFQHFFILSALRDASGEVKQPVFKIETSLN